METVKKKSKFYKML